MRVGVCGRADKWEQIQSWVWVCGRVDKMKKKEKVCVWTSGECGWKISRENGRKKGNSMRRKLGVHDGD